MISTVATSPQLLFFPETNQHLTFDEAHSILSPTSLPDQSISYRFYLCVSLQTAIRCLLLALLLDCNLIDLQVMLYPVLVFVLS